MGDHEDMNIETLVSTLKNYKLFKNKKDILNELLEYNQLHSTSETAIYYSTLLEDFINQIDSSKMKKSVKEPLKDHIISIISLAGASHCQNIVIQQQNEMIAKYDVTLENIKEEYQNERDEHNQLRKKYNEKLKNEKIKPVAAFMPTADLSISLYDKNKFIQSKDIVNLMKANEEKLKNCNGDEFKRISNKDKNGEKINKNIKAIFAKTNENNCNNVVKQI